MENRQLAQRLRTFADHVEQSGFDDSGQRQLVEVLAIAGQILGEGATAPRFQDYGFSSHPPVGSKGLALRMRGASEQAVIVRMEHADSRPKDLPEGGAALYDADGKILKFIPDEAEFNTKSKPITIRTGAWDQDTDGATLDVKSGEATMDAGSDGYTITCGKLTIKATTVVIESADINLGGMGGKPVAVLGSVTTNGGTIVSGTAVKVKAV